MSEDEKRIIALAKEGMPASWIAEEFNEPASWVRVITNKYISAEERKIATRAWSNTWAWIRPKPHILALHREFAPKAVSR